ncbi:hypothetical protein KOI40_17970 [Aestuariicella sp. G3-2]|uniref:hypothetical protein n=1 Tax=Pseudomaricurvus albidus TaxID=2842452 RepID=UPI001C0B2311|nr:hypothetical protein [Aestuariicella albida]MBU3071718.1 hypothetical protein [Aestuariicella albida]
MSISEFEGISVSAREAEKKTNGKRTIDRIEIEISDSLPIKQEYENSRSDFFRGISFSLSINDAEILLEKLGEKLGYIKKLESQGHISIKRYE